MIASVPNQSRREFLKTSAMAAGVGLSSARGVAAARKPESLILDLVHENPGEPAFQTEFDSPALLRSFGYNGKVYSLFESPTLAVNWQQVDPDIFPEGSAAGAWVAARAASIDKQHAACKAAGLQVYSFSDFILLPKTLIEKHKMQRTVSDVRDPQTQHFLRLLLAQVFERFPLLDGMVVRIGETYTDDAPFHAGGCRNHNSPQTILPLAQLLRQELCVRRGKQLIFRTWDSFDTDLADYMAVSDGIEPHPLLAFSVKHCEGDFHRGNPFSKVIGQGRIPQVIEVQCQREYEGKGAYPNYIANGVIDGFEEHRLRPTGTRFGSIGDFARRSPLFRGVWTWSRGGGWEGPYIKNEMWCELNAWVMARWADAPHQSEAAVFHRYATQKLRLGNADAQRFRQLCLLSAQAVLRGLVGTVSGIDPWWTRDDGMMRATLPADAHVLAGLLRDQAQAVAMWQQMLELAGEIHFEDARTRDYVLISTEYGLRLYQIIQAAFQMQAIGPRGDKAALRTWLSKYDEAWTLYRQLPAKSAQCATLYKEGPALKTDREGIDQVVADLRAVANAK
jgi:hypothetical protein